MNRYLTMTYNTRPGRQMLTPTLQEDIPTVIEPKDYEFPKERLIYWRKEGMRFRPGLGLMWEYKSRGFLLMVGKVYLWVRYSGRVKKLFVRCGVQRVEEVE